MENETHTFLKYRADEFLVQLQLKINHRGGIASSLIIDGVAPVAPREGEIVNLGSLEGFELPQPQTHGVVKSVAHTFSGTSRSFRQVVMVTIDELDASAG